MKRRGISLIVALTLCLNLCPVGAFAAVAETAGGLCPHHPEHTEECGYDSENSDASCTFVCPVCSSSGSVLSEASGGLEDPEGDASTPEDGEDSAEPGEAPGDSVLPTVPDEPEEEASAPADEEDSAEPGEAPGDSVLPTVPGEPEDSEGDASTPEDGEDPAEPGEAPDDDSSGSPYSLTENRTYSNPLEISYYSEFKTNEFTFTGTGSSALLVTGTGKLHLTGTIAATNGVGVKVESGGVLYVTGTDTVIRSEKSYGLELDSGATARLSGGTFIGKGAAIRAAGLADLAGLLEPGYAYFDSDGNLVSPADAKTIKILTVGQCSNHEGNKAYAHDSGATTHSWTCPYCGGKETEKCTFPTFDENGNGACDGCGGTITITVNQSALGNLIYDGTEKPGVITTTVDLNDGSGKVLTKDTDYTVYYEPRKDAGEVEVTVTGITFNGTFTKTYEVEQAQPGISWDATTKAVDYDGLPVDELPNVTINIPAAGENPRQHLQYSYRKADEEEFTPGLPTNAGTYEVKAYLPESQNYEEAETNPNLTLTIQKISPVEDAPAAKALTYNRKVQELVTAGRLAPLAAADGAKILFATSENGLYSETIPTGLDANTYEVWYKVEETDNCTGVTKTKIDNVEILRKHITPVVTLSDYTYLYDGGFKQPTVTVKDEDRVTILLDTEYTVEYRNNQNVSTETKPALAIVTDADPDGGNYDLDKVEVKFEITSKTQETLTITQRPNTVIYGDKFTLSTSGGSGSGDVTWEITEGKDTVATIGAKSGQVTIVGDGEFTVKATKSGTDPDPANGVTNYEPATATWTVTADKKPVVAMVTAGDKTYGETYDTSDLKEAKVKAVVEQGVLAGDVITITGLTGTFDDEHAGQDKTVTVNTDNEKIEGKNSEHYDVSYSSLTVKAAIHKAIAHITAAPGAANPTYNGTPQELITAAAVDISGVSAEYSLSKDGPYTTVFPEGTNAGKYTVWYRVQETGDYTGEAPQSMEAEIQKKPVAPTITLSGDGLTEEDNGHCFYIYDGKAKEPAVTLTEADGTTVIPADQYTVGYSKNVNVGTDATVTVTAKADGNYTFTNAPVTTVFEIKQEQAKVITAPVEAGDPLTFSNRAQKLVTAGTASGGKMVYWVDDGVTNVADATFSDQIPAGTDAGDYKVYYKVQGDSNHSDSAVGNLTVTIAPKTVKDATIELKNSDGTTLVDYTYDGTAKTPTVVVKDGSTVIGTTVSGENDEYNVTYSNNTDAGTATVSISAKPGGNYIVTGSTTFVIQKADIVDPSPADAGATYNGKPQELLELNVTGSIGGEIQFALGSPNSAFAPAIPKETNAGTYKVYYRVVGDKNHNDLAVQSVDAAINRKPLSAITIELSPESFVYDGGVKMPAVTVKDGKDVLPAKEYTVTCTDASGTVTTAPMNEGIYTITITDAANGNYDLSGVAANTKTFTIGKTGQAELAIDHSGVTSTNYGDTFQLTTTGGTGNGAVSWSVTGGPATVDASGNVTITGVGEVTITAKKAADTNYLAAQAQWTFTAAPKPVTAAVTVSNKPYDGNTSATVASASITKVNSSDDITIDLASIKAAFETASVGDGKTVTLDTSKVKVTGGGAGKYAISYPETVQANITQETTSITAPEAIAPLIYSGQLQALITAGETNVGFLVYSLDGTSFSKEIPTGTNAGTYTVHYKVDATADYTGVAVNTVSVTIAPKPITPKIELSQTSYVYDGSKKEPKITVKDDKTVIDDDQYTFTWAGTKNQTDAEILTVADTYTATIKSAANGNYTFVDSENIPHDATAVVEIVAASQGSLKITGKPSHVYYGDTITTLDTAGGAGNGTVTWTILDGNSAVPSNSAINPTSGALEIKDVGTFTVTAERTVDNYATVTDTWTFTVEPKPVTAVVTVADKVYDGTNTATVTSAVVSDLVDASDAITIDFDNVVATFDNPNVGTSKTVTLDRSGAVITADTDKYAVTIPATAQANITPRSDTVTVTLSDHDLQQDNNGYFYTYDGTEKRPTVTVTADDDNATLTSNDYTVSYANNKNASTETVTASVTVKAAAGGNYTFASKTVNFEIRNGDAVLTATPQAQDLTFNDTAQDLVTVGAATGGTVVYALDEDGFDKNDADSYSEKIPQGINAGTYTVYYMVKGDANHSDTAPSQLSVTIKPKTITPVITLADENGDPVTASTYTYDGNAKEPAVTVKDGSDTIIASEYTVSYRDNTGAGTATVTISDNNGGNYTVNGTATFEIAKAASVFTTTPAKKDGLQYNGTAQELVTAGGSNDGTVVYSVNGGNYSTAIPTVAAVGTYTVSYKIQGDANHADTAPVTLTVEIAKNTVTNPVISLSSDQFTFNGGQQKPTIEVYDGGGNLIPKNEYTATIDPTIDGDAGIVSVGTYTVTITPTADSNYNIQGTNTKTFEIVPANQETISITGTKAQVRYGETIQLGITGGTGTGTITWKVDGGNGNPVNSAVSATGLLTVKDQGKPLTVTVERTAANHNTVTATWEFSAAKKQVTAVVTATDRPYDASSKTVNVTAVVPDSELVDGDSIKIEDVSGEMDDSNVGTNKKVKVDGSNASVTGTNAECYEITYPATTTVNITAEAAKVTKDPEENTLTYDASKSQELVTAGTATGGTMVYSLDGANFTPAIPKAKDAGTYTVYFKAQGDGNHSDSAVDTKQVTIGKQSVTPQIELTPSIAQYDGKEHKPTVTLWDDDNNVIPASEYKVTYVTDGGANWTDKGDYAVKIEDIDRGNYVVDGATEKFTISATAQNPLEITNKPGLVYYGDTFTLSAVGGSGNARVTWEVDDAGKSIVEIDANGFVKIKGVGQATITAKKSGGDNYNDAEATYPLNALRKPITAIVTADDKVYDSVTPATTMLHFTWSGLVGTDTIDTSNLVGTFVDENVGQNKTVNITGTPADDATAKKYEITIPGTTTASITKADVTVPTLTANDRTYDGSAQDLVSGGNAGTTVYSDTRDGVYTATVPQGTNAGTYTVWYKELGDSNHNDSAPAAVTVTISRKTLDSPTITLSGNDLQTDNSKTPPYSYVFDGSEKRPTVTITDGAAAVPANEYTVSYSDNKNAGTATVTITSNDGGNYTFAEQTVTFEITGAGAQLTSSPQAKDLTYTGQAQELVTVGTASGGHIEYSTDGGTTYSKTIPTETTAGTYTVTYKVVADDNYTDGTETWTVSVTIKPKTIASPKVTVSGTYTYDGSPKIPSAADIEVEDSAAGIISASEYTVDFRDNVKAGWATVIITNANGGNYIVNGTGAFEIKEAAASVEEAPNGKNLPYNGSAQALVTAGKASGGIMVYSLTQTGEYSPVIPTQTAVDNYTVWYKVQGDGNHSDTAPASVNASIVVNTVASPTVQVTPEAATYTGKAQKLTVTVMDGSHVIDGSEYTVTYADSEGNEVTNPINVGTYTLTIASKADGNYSFNATATFEILPADQTPLTITGQRERVYYGDKIQLGTMGGVDGGAIAWKVEDGAPASIDANGLLTISGVGSVKVTATSSAPGYSDKTAAWSFLAEAKPVTAVVTAASKPYDSKTDADVTATLQSSDLVNGDTITIELPGSAFEDANAGTNKRVIVDSSNPTLSGDSIGSLRNYSITYPATATASIFKVDIESANITAPTAVSGLEYDGTAQDLVTAGSVANGEGTMEYSTDGFTYSASLPTGTNAKDYEIWYRVKGGGNHNDTAGTKLGTVTIDSQTVNDPIIEFNPAGATYDSKEHKPTVTVKDKNGNVIPDSEYTVTYEAGKNWTDAGNYKVTVENKDDKTNGNYIITQKAKTFTISMMGQNPLAITNQPGKVQYGDSFTLSTTGGSGTGAVTWSVTAGQDIAHIDNNGLVTLYKAGGPVTVKATKAADSGYASSEATWTFNAAKKPVKAIVTAKDKVYDTNDVAQLVITWKDGDLVGNDEIELVLDGKFTNSNAGENKTVNITGNKPDSDKYDISWNTTTTASITPKSATVTPPTAKTDLAYTGQPQPLVDAGTVDSGNGNVMYSLDGGSTYSLDVPKATNAGTYTVWYKVESGSNYEDSAAKAVSVTIKPKEVTSPVIELSPDTFNYDGNPKKPDVVVKDGTTLIPASEYTVSYSDNAAASGNAKVTISDNPGGNYTVSGTKNFTIKSGAATLTQAPQERELTYTGNPQALVTAGSAVNGHLEYSTDGTTYSTTIPKETNADTYEVYYKVVGNEGYSDTTPQQLSVTIAPKTVTPRIIVTGTYQYDGKPITPDVIVIVDGKRLTEDTDYIVSGSDKGPGTATAMVISLNQNYSFDTIVTFEITKAKAEFLTPPAGKTDLVYTGEAQDLIDVAGVVKNGGIVVYSLDGVNYSAVPPTGTEVKSYTIYTKVLGNDMYADSDVKTTTATIGKNTIADSSLSVTLSPGPYKYTGSEIKPAVTVRDTENNAIIPASEYSVIYSKNINVGEADVTVTSTSKNYSFTKTVHFTITDEDVPELTITGLPDAVYYGDTLRLSATGASGAVTWSIQYGSDAATTQNSGRFEITKPGEITITAATDSASKTVDLYADPKPVTATVIPADKTHDGNTNVLSWTVIVNGLVNGDTIGSGDITVTGQFAGADVGTQNVYIEKLTPSDAVSARYKISYPATATAKITQKAAAVSTAPQKVAQSLTYNGSAQALVTAGTATDGTMMYSLDGTNYSCDIPTGTDATTYTVWYKAVAADKNHEDSTAGTVTGIKISPNTDTPQVICTPNNFKFDGAEKAPTSVVVWDSSNHTIPASEYELTVTPQTAVGSYTVTVTDKPGGNYEFSSTTGGTFKIETGSQSNLTIVTELYDVCYGDSFRLSATGGSGDGAIVWSIPETGVATITQNGVVKVTGTGGFTVEAYRDASGGYGKSNTVSLPFEAHAKPVTPIVTVADKPYDSKTDATLTAKFREGDLVGTDNLVLTVEGKFVSADAGTGKQVDITKHEANGTNADKYDIRWPDSVTGSIYKVDAKLQAAPQAADLTYNNTPQTLLIPGSTVNNIGTIVYSTSQNGTYSTDIPKGTNAGTYSVWYKVADSVNYTGVAPAEIQVEIKKAEPTITSNPTAASGSQGQTLKEIGFNVGGSSEISGKFDWADGNVTPPAGTSRQDVVFTPSDTTNYIPVTIQIDVTVTASTNPPSSEMDTPNPSDVTNSETNTPNAAETNTPPNWTDGAFDDTPTQPGTVQNSPASTTVSAAEGSQLVREAAANRSRNVVIQSETTGNGTKAEASLLSATVSRLGSETDAALTVSSPIADVTIPNAALSTLSREGSTVHVMTEQKDQSVALTLAADGKTVNQVPGGVTLTVPVEDAGPGTVAVLVHDDGTRETIRKSVVGDGVISVPLSGSATVEIVDNSKDFTDVPEGNWAADAVDFAVSHELFNGTSETTFSPGQTMSRGMLATVLYRLEGSPETGLNGLFSDVNDSSYYAESIAWATENGITGGYGDGRFGPDDSITREQFVVMLWRYAGSPKASSQTLDFADADQVSGFAQEALCWAVENNILHGSGDGTLTPGGTATRAHAAQLLKNFMENT